MRVLVFVLAIGVGWDHLGAQNVRRLGTVKQDAQGKRPEKAIDIYPDTTIRTKSNEGYLIQFDDKYYFLGGNSIVWFRSKTKIHIEQGLVCILYEPPRANESILVTTPCGRLCIYGSIVWVQHKPDEGSKFGAQLVTVPAQLSSDEALSCLSAGDGPELLFDGECRYLDCDGVFHECPEIVPMNDTVSWAKWGGWHYKIHFEALTGLPGMPKDDYTNRDWSFEIARTDGNLTLDRFTSLSGDSLSDQVNSFSIYQIARVFVAGPILPTQVAQFLTKGKKGGK